MQALCERLGYQFQNESYLVLALTHRSCGAENNERLEFLGDALLSLIIAEELYAKYSDMPEGQLSRLRANLVNGEVLAVLSKELGINQCMRLGQGELKSGGTERRSILSNSVEAVIGAIYLDGGMEACEKSVLSWYADRIQAAESEGVKKDPKTVLQEYLQAQKKSLPEYIILSMGGKEHSQVFKVKCQVKGCSQTTVGEGTSRRRAEQDAAEIFLALIEKKL